MYDVGTVHGRFQPLHFEHVEYLQEARRRCRHLLIGITAAPRSEVRATSASAHRDRPESNPFSYYERAVMIRAVAAELGWSCDDYSITPFPIDAPELLPEFVPHEAVCFTTICDEWNREKVGRLVAAGYTVEVLWEREKRVTSTQVRDMIRCGSMRWHDLVPPAVARFIEEFGVSLV